MTQQGGVETVLARYLTFNVKMLKSLHDHWVVDHKTCSKSQILVKLTDTSNDLHSIVLGKEIPLHKFHWGVIWEHAMKPSAIHSLLIHYGG